MGRTVGTTRNSSIPNPEICGGGYGQIFTTKNGSSFSIKNDSIKNFTGEGYQQTIYQNGKEVGRIYDDSVRNAVGGGHQKIIEFKDGTKGVMYNDSVRNHHGGYQKIIRFENGKEYRMEDDCVRNSYGGGYNQKITEIDDSPLSGNLKADLFIALMAVFMFGVGALFIAILMQILKLILS